MMNFDVYFPMRSARGPIPGVKAQPMDWKKIVEECSRPELSATAERVANGEKEQKLNLPAICWTGVSRTGHRRDADMDASQLVMIDIDHTEDPVGTWNELYEHHESTLKAEQLCVVHVTPSRKGLRLVFRAVQEISTLSEYMLYLDERFGFHTLGDFDPAVKNIGRLSFLVPYSYFLYTDEEILTGEKDYVLDPITGAGESITAKVKEKVAETPANIPPSAEPAASAETPKTEKQKPSAGKAKPNEMVFDGGVAMFTADEEQRYAEFKYRGFELKKIVEKYVETYGEPGSGERHNYYNEMVKNFRCITDNNKRLLLYALPRFGHTAEECWSQIVSICRVNTLSRLPSSFYFFLKDNGFYERVSQRLDDVKKYMLDEEEPQVKDCPYFPPVFREFVNTAPTDFVVPVVNALLPILGTLTSYVRAIYPYDGREHSTSFFSVIYAPPGTGKGFVERFMDLLFVDLKLRDFVQSERENVYLRLMMKKGANDKSPDLPHVSLRLIPPKNSEAEFLQKQRDNNGYHMFTYAAEMDSWAKGVKAAGGNKDDMIRIAWDNGEYGQQFKSVNTFKGIVKLYWNVLITGTIQQVESYFKNVENGLVTRCSFCSIENQEFTAPPVWKNLTKRNKETITRFTSRCDAMTYESPCTIDPSDLLGVSDDDFDKTVEWRFKFKEKKLIDMSWVMPLIDAFHEEQMKLASLDVDRARDVFRRRVGVRGFRLAMLCYCLWENPRESDLKKCLPFIDWWMHTDLDNMLKLWGAKYNEQTDFVPHVLQRCVYDSLANVFDRNDVYNVCLKQGIKTPVRRILHDWRKMNHVEQIEKNKFKKKTVSK